MAKSQSESGVSCARYLVRQYDQPGYEYQYEQAALAVDYPFRFYVCVWRERRTNFAGSSERKEAWPEQLFPVLPASEGDRKAITTVHIEPS